MYIEILLLAVSALVLFGLCRSTEIAVTIRHSEGFPHKRTGSHFE